MFSGTALRAKSGEMQMLSGTGPQWFSVAPFAHKGRWRNFNVFGALSFVLNFNIFWNFFAHFFCCTVSSCVYDHSHPYLVSECLFLAENKAFPYPRRLRAILWDAAATCSVVILVVVAEKKRSSNLSVSWLTPYGLVDRLPVSAGNFRWALQRHLSIDFQNQDIIGKILSCSKRAYFAFVNRTRNGWTAPARNLPTHRFRDWSKTEPASVRGTAASFVDRFSNPRFHWKDLCLLWTTHVLLLWIEREMAEQRPLEVCRSIVFAIDWRPRPLWSSTFLQAIQSTRDMRCIRHIDLKKVWNEVQKFKTFFLLFSRGKGKENFKLCMCCRKTHTQYFYTIVNYDTPNPR